VGTFLVRGQLGKLHGEQRNMLDQERNKREEFQQMKVQ
jgi:hypothetical protein